MSVEVTQTTLEKLSSSFETFKEEFVTFTSNVCWEARLQPKIVDFRLRDAYQLWQKDLDRVKKADELHDGLDHFKQCGHLGYWLRRSSPIVEFIDYSSAYTESAGSMGDDANSFRDLLYQYGTEYLAFDWAYEICLFHERTRSDKSSRADTLQLSRDYIRTVCHFMKCKHVSPHALSLILKSLFQ